MDEVERSGAVCGRLGEWEARAGGGGVVEIFFFASFVE